jgi:hypothetical protein
MLVDQFPADDARRLIPRRVNKLSDLFEAKAEFARALNEADHGQGL